MFRSCEPLLNVLIGVGDNQLLLALLAVAKKFQRDHFSLLQVVFGRVPLLAELKAALNFLVTSSSTCLAKLTLMTWLHLRCRFQISTKHLITCMTEKVFAVL